MSEIQPVVESVDRHDTTVDPITLQLIRGSLRSARLECELLIERTAMSAFIREKKDYTVSFLDHRGKEIYGETLGSDILGCVWECYPPDTMHSGDVYWYNDPYISQGSISHTPDMVFITPVFFEDEIVAYCHSFAHFWGPGRLPARQHRPGQHRDLPRRHAGPAHQDRRPGQAETTRPTASSCATHATRTCWRGTAAP